MRTYHGIHIWCFLPTLNAVEQWLREICNSTWVESDSRSCPALPIFGRWHHVNLEGGLCSWKLALQEQNARSNHGLDCRKGSSCRPSPSAAPCPPSPASAAHLLRYSHLPLVSSIHIPSGILIPSEHSLVSSCELCGTAVSLFSSSFVPLPLPLSGPICFPCAEKLGFNSRWTFSRQTYSRFNNKYEFRSYIKWSKILYKLYLIWLWKWFDEMPRTSFNKSVPNIIIGHLGWMKEFSIVCTRPCNWMKFLFHIFTCFTDAEKQNRACLCLRVCFVLTFASL